MIEVTQKEPLLFVPYDLTHLEVSDWDIAPLKWRHNFIAFPKHLDSSSAALIGKSFGESLHWIISPREDVIDTESFSSQIASTLIHFLAAHKYTNNYADEEANYNYSCAAGSFMSNCASQRSKKGNVTKESGRKRLDRRAVKCGKVV